jgi:hypothetical protein
MTRDQNSITIFPNPTENNISFSIGELKSEIITVEYINAQGIITKEQVDLTNKNSFESTIFMNLRNGMYLVRIYDENNTLIQSEKLIKI